MASPIFALGTSLSAPVIGNANGTVYTMADLADENGLVIAAHGIGYAGTLPTTATIFQRGCLFIETDRGSVYNNVGTTASPSWFHIAGT